MSFTEMPHCVREHGRIDPWHVDETAAHEQIMVSVVKSADRGHLLSELAMNTFAD